MAVRGVMFARANSVAGLHRTVSQQSLQSDRLAV
jgi:hypothetical protein